MYIKTRTFITMAHIPSSSLDIPPPLVGCGGSCNVGQARCRDRDGHDRDGHDSPIVTGGDRRSVKKKLLIRKAYPFFGDIPPCADDFWQWRRWDVLN